MNFDKHGGRSRVLSASVLRVGAVVLKGEGNAGQCPRRRHRRKLFSRRRATQRQAAKRAWELNWVGARTHQTLIRELQSRYPPKEPRRRLSSPLKTLDMGALLPVVYTIFVNLVELTSASLRFD